MAETRDPHPPTADPRPGDGPDPAPAHPSPVLSSQATTPTPPTASSPNATTEITTLYLTFTTPLPTPNTTLRHPSKPPPPNNNPGPPPPAPNLTPYTNPQTWPSSRKHLLLALSCVATCLTAYTAGSYSPPQDLIRASLAGDPSEEAVLAGITTFCLGFAFAPMVLAPLSEMNGRYPVFVVAGIVYVVFQGVCGVVTNLAGMLVARFLVGAGASVFSTMVGGVIADMWDARGRNTPMAVFSGSVLAGTGAGPLVGAVMAERLAEEGRWKWIFWHQVIMGGVMMVLVVVFFRESRGSVLLSRKARALNKWYEKLEEEGYFGVWGVEEGPLLGGSLKDGGDEEKGSISDQQPTTNGLRRIRWLVKEDEERASLGKMIATSISRPFHFLFTEPVVFFFSLWVAFAWGILYLTFGSIPLVFQDVYGWSLEQSGYVFVALIIGAILATAIGLWQDRILYHPKWAISPLDTATGPSSGDTSDDSSNKHASSARPSRSDRIWGLLRRRFPAAAPESRLYFTCLTSTLLPIGLFIFGFSSSPDIHWIGPAVGLVLATMGILSIYLAVFNYFADTYHKYASSALAAQSFCRNVLGGAFPLVTGPLFTNLGPARAGAVLGGIATALTVVPWVLVFFGGRIRARSPFASQLGST